MYKGKRTCKILKEIRAQIAAENDIAFVTSECKYQGDCAGTCPKCEAEVRYLERELERRVRLGKAVTVAGLAVTLTASSVASTACAELFATQGDMLVDGDMQPPPYTDILGGEDVPCDGILLPTLATLTPHLEDEATLHALVMRAFGAAEGASALPTRALLQQNSWTEAGMWQREEEEPDGLAITDYYLLEQRTDSTSQAHVETWLRLHYTRESVEEEYLLTRVSAAVVTDWWDMGELPAPALLLPEIETLEQYAREEAADTVLALLREALAGAEINKENNRGVFRHQSNWESAYLYTQGNVDYYEIAVSFDPSTQVETVLLVGLLFAASPSSGGEALALEGVCFEVVQGFITAGDPVA